MRVQTMADGTLRLVVDFPPGSAQSAFRLFGAPGTPVSAARIKTTAEQRKQPGADEAQLKGGPLARLAGQWCNDEKFLEFIRPRYVRMMEYLGNDHNDVTPATFGEGVAGTRGYARHCLLVICKITSRAALDNNAEAADRFHRLIREPFAAYLRGRA